MKRISKILRRHMTRSSAKRESPSILDFPDERKLREAMKADEGSKVPTEEDDGPTEDFASVEWTLPVVDKENSLPQSMDDEVKRLLTLSSYFVLDAKAEEEFDRMTRLAATVFDVPVALFALMDLSRNWFLSTYGVDLKESPRKISFCGHTILSRYKMMVIPDTSKDFRFKDNPLVTGGPKVRFYAGAALVSPEGHSLGTLCILSPTPRPGGLTDVQITLLREMADMAMSSLVARRNRLLKEEYETYFQGISTTLIDTYHGLEDVRSSLMNVDRNKKRPEVVDAAVQELDIHAKVCSAVVRQISPLFEGGNMNNVSSRKKDDEVSTTSTGTTASTCSATSADMGSAISPNSSPRSSTSSATMTAVEEDYLNLMSDYERIANPTTDMQRLFDNINMVIPNLPFKGTVTVQFDESVPKEMISEDALIFRCVLNLISHCCCPPSEDQPGDEGSNDDNPSVRRSGLRIRKMKTSENQLLIEGLQYGKPTHPLLAKDLFKQKDSLLRSVASMVRTLGGRYGTYEGKWNLMDNDGFSRSSSALQTQSIFWFQIPYDTQYVGTDDRTLGESYTKTHGASSSSPSTPSPVSSSRKILNTMNITMDPFQEAMAKWGC